MAIQYKNTVNIMGSDFEEEVEDRTEKIIIHTPKSDDPDNPAKKYAVEIRRERIITRGGKVVSDVLHPSVPKFTPKVIISAEDIFNDAEMTDIHMRIAAKVDEIASSL